MQRYRKEEKEEDSSLDTDDDYVPYVPVKDRKKQLLTKLGKLTQLKEDGIIGKSSSDNEKDDADNDDGQVWGRKSNISLLDQHTELKKLAEGIPKFCKWKG